jgi:hypothetical protein
MVQTHEGLALLRRIVNEFIRCESLIGFNKSGEMFGKEQWVVYDIVSSQVDHVFIYKTIKISKICIFAWCVDRSDADVASNYLDI